MGKNLLLTTNCFAVKFVSKVFTNNVCSLNPVSLSTNNAFQRNNCSDHGDQASSGFTGYCAEPIKP